MTPAIWQELAKAVYDEIKHGVTGVMVTHGTDTMAYSAAALSFMIDTPVPVIFVGSQRSADRPSSDNAMNAVCAASAAKSDLGEVAVVMHATTNDDTCAIHRGTRVRKMHTSRRDAFKSIGIPPVGTVDYSTRAVTLKDTAVRRGTRKLALHDKLEPRCALIQFYPGMSPDLLKAYEGYKGLVLSGTGLGHVSTALIPPVKKLIADGTQVVMTSQCMNGRVCDGSTIRPRPAGRRCDRRRRHAGRSGAHKADVGARKRTRPGKGGGADEDRSQRRVHAEERPWIIRTRPRGRH